MGTKKDYIELQEILRDEVRSHPFLSREWKISDRRYKLAEILNDLGFLPEYDDEYDAIAVEYRNRRYSCDVVRVDVLSVFSVIGQLDKDEMSEYDASAIADVIHEVNSNEVMAKIYVVGGEVSVMAEQFLGKRDIEENEVAFLIKCMDEAAREFCQSVKANDFINEYVVCR